MKADLALLLIRCAFGGSLLLSHGLQKLMHFSELSANFADPYGVLGPTISLALVTFAEAFCSSAVIVGFFTRLAAIPVVISMATAFVFIHGNDPWAKKEMAFLYAITFTAIAIAGAGKYSLDHLIWNRSKSRRR